MTPSSAPVSDLALTFSTRRGTVLDFDDKAGVGHVSDEDSRERWWFHCTRIAGGSRTIASGRPVTYRVVPGPGGLEAVDVG